jgi:putative nucleotidyltransferase with HDIG domain
MNNYGEFQKIVKLIPTGSKSIDWDGLARTGLAPIFSEMARTYQNPKYHGEIDVLSHTKMVCEEIIKQPEYVNGSDIDRTVLFLSALLHDVGKIACTVEREGEFVSPHHSSKGAIMARALLWRKFGLCGSREKQQLRESICNLVRYHSFPPYAIKSENAELRLLKIASNGVLAENFSIEKLCVLERADVLGRIQPQKEESKQNFHIRYIRYLHKRS